MRGIIVLAAATLAACSNSAPEQRAADATSEKAAATDAASPSAEVVATEATVDEAQTDQSPPEEFYSACVIGKSPATQGPVFVPKAPVAAFLNYLTGDAQVTWELVGDETYIGRAQVVDQLTQKTSDRAVQIRRVNAAPLEDGICGPRAVIVERLGIDGEELPAGPLYQTTVKIANDVGKEIAASPDPAGPYVEPPSTENDPPYTETILTWEQAIEAARKAR